MEAIHVFDKTVTCAFSDKTDGNMSFRYGEVEAVLQNRFGFLRKNAIKQEMCVVMAPIHGDSITRVARSDTGGITDAEKALESEAFVTNQQGIFLFLQTADCSPVAYHDPQTSVVALAHVGWKPAGMRVPALVIEQMAETFGSQAENIRVYIGPGIKKESYLVTDPEQKNEKAWLPYMKAVEGDTYTIDIPGFIRAQLSEAGVLPDNITESKIDTNVALNQFSHFRAKRGGEQEGRFATVIGLK